MLRKDKSPRAFQCLVWAVITVLWVSGTVAGAFMLVHGQVGLALTVFALAMLVSVVWVRLLEL